MSLLTYGCLDPTKGRTEEPHITSIWGKISLDGEKWIHSKFNFRIYNGIIDCIDLFIQDKETKIFDVRIQSVSTFDTDFRSLLRFYGIQFEEINY